MAKAKIRWLKVLRIYSAMLASSLNFLPTRMNLSIKYKWMLPHQGAKASTNQELIALDRFSFWEKACSVSSKLYFFLNLSYFHLSLCNCFGDKRVQLLILADHCDWGTASWKIQCRISFFLAWELQNGLYLSRWSTVIVSPDWLQITISSVHYSVLFTC